MTSYALTYPLDVLKSRIQATAEPLTLTHAARVLRDAHGGGRAWLAAGVGPTLLRAFVINAVNFATFERARAALCRL